MKRIAAIHQEQPAARHRQWAGVFYGAGDIILMIVLILFLTGRS